MPGAPMIGRLRRGPLDAISDVPGVSVGHHTRDEQGIQTGVTVIRPHGGDVYLQKVPAAATVINGFGKSIGLMQIDELGLMETPIALTNTFAVGTVANAQIRQACQANREIGRGWSTVNPLVFECNDGYLNDIQAMAVTEADYLFAYQNASEHVAQGSVGAGRGMSCFGMKGGIGSASRLIEIANEERPFTVGVLVLANFGVPDALTVAGVPMGQLLAARLASANAPAPNPGFTRGTGPTPTATDAVEKGSIIMIIATDAPLDANQLRRVSARAAAGLARCGSVYGHGSGDIALAFSTAYTVAHDVHAPVRYPSPYPSQLIHPAAVDPLFVATAEAVEQAIVHALWRATSVTGRDGHQRRCLLDVAPDWQTLMACP